MKFKFSFEIAILIIFTFLYFISRLANLNAIPVFGDEAIYIRWSQIIKSVDTLRFIPQTDGKQPLFMWLTVIIFKFISDPLIAGRIVSVLSGYVTMITIFVFAKIFINTKSAYIASFLYISLPFAYFFDRMALPDNLLSMFGALSLLFSFILAKYQRLDIAIILGAILGLAWLTKSPAIYFVVLSLITYSIYNLPKLTNFYLPILSGLIGYCIYNILRLGPQFNQIAIRNRDYIWSFSEILQHPLDPLIPHLKDFLQLSFQYISVPVIIIFFLLLVTRHYQLRSKTFLLLGLWFLLPLFTNLTIAKVFTLRYILFILPSLILLLSLVFSQSKLKYPTNIILLVVILIPSYLFNYQLSNNPYIVKLYATERGYLQSWTSGWGIKRAASYLINRSYQTNVIVGTEGYFGTLPDGLQIYTNQVPQLTVFGVGLDLVKIPEKLVDAHNFGDEVYILINQSRIKLTPEEQQKVELVQSYPKPDGDSLILYRLI